MHSFRWGDLARLCQSGVGRPAGEDTDVPRVKVDGFGDAAGVKREVAADGSVAG